MSLTTVSPEMTSGVLLTANKLAELSSYKSAAQSNLGVDRANPVGTVLLWAGSTVPADWAQCNGAEFSQTSYADLYTALGSTFNTGGESPGNFRVPNLTALSSGNVKYIIKTGPAVA